MTSLKSEFIPAIHRVFDQLADLTARLAPSALLELKATLDMQQRYEQLIRQRNAETLSPEEKDELDHFIVLERLVRIAKIKADAGRACAGMFILNLPILPSKKLRMGRASLVKSSSCRK